MSRTPGFVDFKWEVEFSKQVIGWTDDQCRAAWAIIKARWNEVHTEKALESASKFHVGQRVQFQGSRGRGTIQGTIDKINTKTVALRDCSDGGRGWRVAPSLLEPATEIIAANVVTPAITDISAKVGAKAEDVLEVITSKAGDSTFIHRRDFSKREWDVLQGEARKNLPGRTKAVLYGGECFKCKKNGNLLVHALKVHPEVVSLGYRCIFCGQTDSDVMD